MPIRHPSEKVSPLPPQEKKMKIATNYRESEGVKHACPDIKETLF